MSTFQCEELWMSLPYLFNLKKKNIFRKWRNEQAKTFPKQCSSFAIEIVFECSEIDWIKNLKWKIAHNMDFNYNCYEWTLDVEQWPIFLNDKWSVPRVQR